MIVSIAVDVVVHAPPLHGGKSLSFIIIGLNMFSVPVNIRFLILLH